MKWILDLFKKIQSVGKREPVVEINYCEKVNQDLEIIKTEYNKACQQAYSILEANKDSEDKEFEWAKDLIRANKTPSFKRIYMDTSLYQIEMDITAEHDAIVIFESMVVKELNKSAKTHFKIYTEPLLLLFTLFIVFNTLLILQGMFSYEAKFSEDGEVISVGKIQWVDSNVGHIKIFNFKFGRRMRLAVISSAPATLFVVACPI